MRKRGSALAWSWSSARIAIFLRFAAFAPIVAGCVYLLVYLPTAPAIAVIEATIQSVTFEVSVPEMAQIRVTGFALNYQSPSMGKDLGFQNKTVASPTSLIPLCLKGLLVPESGTRITYKRFGTSPVSVTFERIRRQAGGLIFGKTFEPSAISEGATRIYPASTASITLPPGSRITEYVPIGQPHQPWAGFALADVDKALKVKVSTPATRLAIIRPGLSLKPEILSIGLFTQLIHDPILVWAQIVVALLFSVLRMLSAAFSMFSSRTNRSMNDDEVW